jgi:hypothetical protein
MRVARLVPVLAVVVSVGVVVPAGAEASRSCGMQRASGSLPGGLGWEAFAREIRVSGLSCETARPIARRLAIARAGHGSRPAGWKARGTATGRDGFPRVTYARGNRRITFIYANDEG